MTFTGTYYGASAGSTAGAGEPVRLSLTAAGLVIEREAAAVAVAAPIVWPLAEIRRNDGAVAGAPVRLERAGDLLFVSDRVLLDALGHPMDRGVSALWKALALMAAVMTGAGLACYFWLLPWIADVMARHVPESVEAEIGKAAVEQLAPRGSRVDDPEVRRPVQDVVSRLAGPGGSARYQLFVVRNEAVNALATPGGFIVVYTGLLGKTESPEELAAVLAHEMTHVTERHGLQALMRGLAFWALLGYALGDTGGVLVQSAGALGELTYRRGQEEAADRGAMQIFEERRLDSRAMVRVFEMLEREEGNMPEPLRYLSTHPRVEDRLRTMREWAEKARWAVEPIDVEGSRWPPRAGR